MSFSEVQAEGGRCVFKGPVSYYKVFIPFENETIDELRESFQREYFITNYVSQNTKNSKNFPQVLSGGYNLDSAIRAKLAAVSNDDNCQRALLNFSTPIFFIESSSIQAEPLDKWLQNSGPLSFSTIQKFAFQLTWLLDELHTQFGIQHNDIQEHNIMVRKITGLAEKILLRLGDDYFFVLTLEPGELMVYIIDFGFAEIHSGRKEDNDPRIWRTPSGGALLHNNPPEAFFPRNEVKKNSEGDTFQMGLVLLTLLAHGRWGTYRYSNYSGAHAFDLLNEANALGVKPLKVISDNADKVLDPKSPLWGPDRTNTAENKGKIVTMLITNFLGLDKALHGRVTMNSDPYYVVKPLITKLNKPDDKTLAYATAQFSSLLDLASSNPELVRFLRRSLFFVPEDRAKFSMPLKKWGLTSALFHPYFASLYVGNQIPPELVGTVPQRIETFSPPLEYNQKDSDVQGKLQRLEMAEQQFAATPVVPIVVEPPEDSDDKGKEEEAEEGEETEAEPEPEPEKPEVELEEEKPVPVTEVPEVLFSIEECQEWIKSQMSKQVENASGKIKVDEKRLEEAQRCINLLGQLAMERNNPELLEQLKLISVLAADNRPRRAAYGDTAPDNQIFGYDQSTTKVQIASNASYLALGLYAMTKPDPILSRQEFLSFKQALDDIEGTQKAIVKLTREYVEGNFNIMKEAGPMDVPDDAQDVKEKMRGLLREMQKGFDLANFTKGKRPDTEVQGTFLAPMREFAILLDQEMDQASYERLQKSWPERVSSYGWSGIQNPTTGRTYAMHSIIYSGKSGELVPPGGLLDQRLKGMGYRVSEAKNEGGANMYQTMLGHTLFMLAAERALNPEKNLPTPTAGPIDGAMTQAFRTKTGALRKDFAKNIRNTLNAFQLSEITAAPFINESIVSKSAFSLSEIQAKLEVIETLEEYNDQGKYLRNCIIDDLVTPLIEAVAEHAPDMDDVTLRTFETLGLYGDYEGISISPTYETRYYHALSLASELLADPGNQEIIERIETEWPLDLMSGTEVRAN